MKKKLSLFLLFIALFSCSKEKKYAVTTSNPKNIKACSVIFVGNSQGTQTKIEQRGFCYSADKIPKYGDNNVFTSNHTIEYYEVKVSILKANTSYNVRAFSKLTDGSIIYGDVVEFSTSNEYELGDTGPGGGIIFNLNTSSNYKYSEALSKFGPDMSFGCNLFVGTTFLRGDAESNTNKITASCGYSNAAGYVSKLEVNGLSDWYLPTIYDLADLYSFYNDRNIDFSYNMCLSSSEYNNELVEAFDFSIGENTLVDKSAAIELIAIRYFN